MKINLLAACVGISLLGIMLSSSADKGKAITANQAPPMPGLQTPNPIAFTSVDVPFAVYLSLLISFTNGQPIDFNTLDENGQSSILDRMTNWKEEQ